MNGNASRFITSTMALVAFFCLLSYAQIQRMPSRPEITVKTNATCYDDKTGTLVGSQFLRSPLFVSPDGNASAYTENEAVALQSTSDASLPGPDCKNHARLFVAIGDNKSFRQVLPTEPTEELGEEIQIIDWSPDGRSLLLEYGLFYWASEMAGNFVRIYDTRTGSLSDTGLIDHAFIKYAKRKCCAVVKAVGFSSNDEIVVTAQPYFDFNEDSPSGDSCVAKKGIWRFDRKSKAVSPLPAEYTVQHYGKYAEAPKQQR